MRTLHVINSYSLRSLIPSSLPASLSLRLAPIKSKMLNALGGRPTTHSQLEPMEKLEIVSNFGSQPNWLFWKKSNGNSNKKYR